VGKAYSSSQAHACSKSSPSLQTTAAPDICRHSIREPRFPSDQIRSLQTSMSKVDVCKASQGSACMLNTVLIHQHSETRATTAAACQACCCSSSSRAKLSNTRAERRSAVGVGVLLLFSKRAPTIKRASQTSLGQEPQLSHIATYS
jgi:hypothetical protein